MKTEIKKLAKRRNKLTAGQAMFTEQYCSSYLPGRNRIVVGTVVGSVVGSVVGGAVVVVGGGVVVGGAVVVVGGLVVVKGGAVVVAPALHNETWQQLIEQDPRAPLRDWFI